MPGSHLPPSDPPAAGAREAPPLPARVDVFLGAVRGGRTLDAEEMLGRDAALAGAELSVACVLGDEPRVAAHLAADPGAASRPRREGDWPPLLYACASWRHERGAEDESALARTVERLLDAGASPNTFMLFDPDDEHSRIPALFFASMRGNASVTRLLLERGAEPNDGESIYHAAEMGRVACLELLLAHGADPRGRHPHWGNTPLFFLMGHVEGGALAPSADRGVRWLLEHGADPEVTSGALEETALHCAARVGRGEAMIDMLVAHGAGPSRPRRDGATPHALALRHGHAATAAALAARGADTRIVRAADGFLGDCARGDEAAARARLAACPDLVASLGAEAGEFVALIALRADPAPLRVLLALGFPVDGAPGGRDTPLHRAAWHGRPANVRLLLERGARVNVRDDEYDCSALAWACHGSVNCRDADADYEAVIDLLIEAGADRETAISRGGWPPESMATPAVARHLRARGFAPPEAR